MRRSVPGELVLNNQGVRLATEGDRVRAAALFEKALTNTRDIGAGDEVALLSLNLADTLMYIGRSEEAAEVAREGLLLPVETAQPCCASAWGGDCRGLRRTAGDAEAATRLLGAADAIRRRSGEVEQRSGAEERERSESALRDAVGRTPATPNYSQRGRGCRSTRRSSTRSRRSTDLMASLPSGTVTFLFTDVEGSTRLLHELGAERYAEALAEHRRVIREACAADGGVEVDTQGDAFFFAFPTAPGAVAAAEAMTEALAAGPIRGAGRPAHGRAAPHRGGLRRRRRPPAARVAACGHGGQVLVSPRRRELVELDLTDLGEHRLKDIAAPVRIFQLGDGEFPPLKTSRTRTCRCRRARSSAATTSCSRCCLASRTVCACLR